MLLKRTPKSLLPLDLSYICWSKSIIWDDSQTNHRLSMSSAFHSFVCDPFISSSLLLCINSDSPVWLSLELDALAKWSWRHSFMPLMTLWVVYLILPRLENCNLVLLPCSYSSFWHLVGSMNVCLLPRGVRNGQLNFFSPYFFPYFSPSLIFSAVSPSSLIFHLSPW